MIVGAFILLSLLPKLWTLDLFDNADFWPSSVTKYDVRQYNNKPVQTGLLHSLPKKSTITDFRKHLQCPEIEPNLAWNSGAINILQMVPPTNETLTLMCAFIESKLGCQWNDCRKKINPLKSGNFDKSVKFAEISRYSNPKLLRVIKGELYYDWPWGIDRYDVLKEEENLIAPLMKMTLDRVSDIGDSVFFVGGEQAIMSYDKPVPIFSFSTSETYADMPWPWWEMWQSAIRAYKLFRSKKLEFTESNYKKETAFYLEWNKRIPKAAFFDNLIKSRQYMFDAARQYPHLFDAHFAHTECVTPWNPSSSENCTVLKHYTADELKAAQSLPGGYLLPLMSMHGETKELERHIASYKYVIVPLGDGMTSDRLAQVLTFSGAVVLMQRSAHKYHFSSHFLPWVHYVPLSYSGADAFEKIQWLVQHDDFAKQIAENGRNFARSYLRLEDYYCYAANALEAMAEISAMTDVTSKMFDPRKLLPFKVVKNETNSYEWPI